MDDIAIDRLETALRAAIADHRTALRAELCRQSAGFERRFLLARLGLARDALDAAASVACAAELPAVIRTGIAGRLAVEAARLVRLARAGSHGYDVNRHIAVQRTLLWLGRETAAPAPAADRVPGSVLNRRFAGPRKRPLGARPLRCRGADRTLP